MDARKWSTSYRIYVSLQVYISYQVKAIATSAAVKKPIGSKKSGFTTGSVARKLSGNAD